MAENKNSIIRLGIIGTGRIANRMVAEVGACTDIASEAVLNPHTQSAKVFGDKYDIQWFDEEREFFNHVDAVYIATPHQTHYQYIKDALLAGKHVLCEKPMVLCEQEAKELFDMAAERELVLMEGIKTAYCPGFAKLIEIAQNGCIGDIRNVQACFTKLESKESRELTDRVYGGSLLELGSYCILPIVRLFGTECENIEFSSIYDENTGLDLFTKVLFEYKNGMAQADCGLGVKSEGQMIISGTKGYIVVKAPWWKTTYFEVRHENPNDVEAYSAEYEGDGLRYEMRELVSRIRSGNKSEGALRDKESSFIAKVLEDFLDTRENAILKDSK